MRILIAPDKFKGSLGAAEVGRCIAAGLRAALPQAELEIQPVADGGEGTAEVIRQARGGEWIECATQDAFGQNARVRYAWLLPSRTAVLEMSAAAGATSTRRDVRRASTFGVGEMLRVTAERGARQIVLGLGGSITNDAGVGMARALGFRFLASDGAVLPNDVTALARLARIEWPNELRLPPIIGAADVRNPLLGPDGATRVFGPQKGATPEELEALERALTRLAEVAAESGRDFRETPGAGAAGGLGFGLLAFCGATLRPGFEVVAEAIDLEKAIARADLVVTGEGKLDRQTLAGKAPAGVARMARAAGKPIYAIVGQTSGEPAVHALFERVLTLDDDSVGYIESAARLEASARTLAATFPA